jgi:hypothetical protein
MILIDTNVISEPWRPARDPGALEWIDAQAIETLYRYRRIHLGVMLTLPYRSCGRRLFSKLRTQFESGGG